MRVRLWLSFTLVILVTLAAVVYFTSSSTVQEVTTFVRRGGLAGVDRLVTALEEYYALHNSWQGAQSLLAAYRPAPQGNDGQHADGHQEMMGPGMRMGSDIVLVDQAGVPRAGTGEFDAGRTVSTDELANAIALTAEGKTVGYLLSENFMSMPAANYQEALDDLLSRAAWQAALVAGLMALLLASFLAFLFSRPIRQLTQAAGRLAGGDLSERVQIRGWGEMAALGESFNMMSAALERSDQNRKAMTADIAHELRSPLAVQRASLEALEDGMYDLSVENLAPVIEQNRLLTRLVEDLHTLSLSDAQKLPLHRSPTDISELVQTAISIHQPQAQSRNIELRLLAAVQDPMEISVDRERIQQILGNLLQNAIRHAPQNGQVEISCTQDEKLFTLEVRDNGAGIPSGEEERIFERFYRSDASRSRQAGGSGLGLTIARRLAQAHGGTLTASNHSRGGAVFTLSLPFSGTEED